MSRLGLTKREEARAEALRTVVVRDDEELRPLGSMVCVEMIPEDRTEGGIVLPAGVRVRHQGRVISTGPGTPTRDGVLVPTGVEPGDLVLLSPTELAINLGRGPSGGHLVMVLASTILGVITRRAT